MPPTIVTESLGKAQGAGFANALASACTYGRCERQKQKVIVRLNSADL